jgi:hypothetical protein
MDVNVILIKNITSFKNITLLPILMLSMGLTFTLLFLSQKSFTFGTIISHILKSTESLFKHPHKEATSLTSRKAGDCYNPLLAYQPMSLFLCLFVPLNIFYFIVIRSSC